MDLLLPDEGTMELMREKFESMDIDGRARAATGAIAACMTDTYCETDGKKAQNSRRLHKNDIFGTCKTRSDEADMRGDIPYIVAENVPLADNADLEKADTHDDRLPEKTSEYGDASGENMLQQDGAEAEKGQNWMLHTLLYLYFIKVLGYNSRYGTQIYDAQRSLGGLRSIVCAFRQLNGLL